MGVFKDHLNRYAREEGVFWTEWQRVKNIVHLYCKGKIIFEGEIKLTENGRTGYFWAIIVSDLRQAYMVAKTGFNTELVFYNGG